MDIPKVGENRKNYQSTQNALSHQCLIFIIYIKGNISAQYLCNPNSHIIKIKMIRLINICYFCATTNSLNNKVYTLASKMGGASTDRLYEVYAGKFHNQAIFDFKKDAQNAIPGATIITTPQQCKRCMEVLMKTNTIVAWDTQTMDLDIKNEAPVGKGRIICASFFAGPQYNFGNGPRVFIDNFGTNAGLINYFKDYLESPSHKKVFHNYGFDRHLFYNHGINVLGFGGDTMHMARLYDSGKMFGQYSLAALTKQFQTNIIEISTKSGPLFVKGIQQKYNKLTDDQKEEKDFLSSLIMNVQKYQKEYIKAFKFEKTKMDELFKRKKILKSGEEGATYEYPSTLTLHTNAQYLKNWIEYSVLDSEATFYLRQVLELKLKKQLSSVYKGLPNMFVLYEKYWLPFGEILTDMEREGFKIDFDHMKSIEQSAQQKLSEKRKEFLEYLKKFQTDPNIDLFNPSSALQLQQLIHAPYKVNPPKKQEKKLTFTGQEAQLLEQSSQSDEQYYQPKSKINRKPTTFDEEIKVFKVENLDPSRGKKKIDMAVKGLGIPAEKTTPLGLPSVDQSVLQILAGNPKLQKYGKAFDFFKQKGDQEFGKFICNALSVLIQYRNIETLVKTFIMPLRGFADQKERIHCSLNINTQTGRLSARKPNLQNQPALEKDIYKIRKAFCAQKGKKLIVSDYGQLQLRVLAHLTNCQAMIKAFKEGGDFHSRTAIGMYDYIRKDLAEGKILLEWDKSKGIPPVPLLKDKYASERKQAKTVNFSIAYGKTAHGFAEDWNCSLPEAKKIIQAWFSDRPQVRQWQKKRQQIAMQFKYTQTLLGRFRKLDRFFVGSVDKAGMRRGMMNRRAINTPIQGGAADIVIAAMINIARNQRLKELGWKLLMQIHDQLILEGPQQSTAQAFAIVKHQMEHPFQQDLLVALQVDAKIGNTWYECK